MLICVRICSKFSVKCEATHKNIVIVDFLMLVAFKQGELAPIGKYHIGQGIFSKIRGLTNFLFLFYDPVQVEQLKKSVAQMTTTYHPSFLFYGPVQVRQLIKSVAQMTTTYHPSFLFYDPVQVEQLIKSVAQMTTTYHPSFLFYGPVQVRQLIKRVALMTTTYQLLPWLSQSTSRVLGMTSQFLCQIQ